MERSEPGRPLRLWPGVAIVAVVWVVMLVVPAAATLFAPMFVTEARAIGILAGAVGGVGVAVWWALFSRATVTERLGGIALLVAAFAATPLILHESIATGMMGLMFPFYALPIVGLTFVLWALFGRRLGAPAKRTAMALAVVVPCASFGLLRTGGFTGDIDHDLAWRWEPTPEDRLVATTDEPMSPAVKKAAPAGDAPAWPGFRGPMRDSVVRATHLATDWEKSPPTELWRRKVGPGWSSFAVRGDLFYTQEQRGEDELVSCYRVGTGKPVWRHRDKARFWESNAGAGPRATPALADGRVYTLGGTGTLNALDARDGSVVWQRDAAKDGAVKIPGWGLAGSPLVSGDLLLVAAAGKLLAYDRATGEPRWSGPDGVDGYSSPHGLTLGGVPQLVLMSQAGAVSFSPAGKKLWDYPWRGGSRIVQPALTGDGDLLFSKGESGGLRRVAVAREGDTWKLDERWTTARLKPFYSDLVVHRGHAYGFNGSMLACLDVAAGARKWRGGRYGAGQLLLLADQDLLLVLSERGALVLVAAVPDEFRELARHEVLEGKTWNHPVLAGDALLVRNAEEMAAFRLAQARD